MSSIFLGVAGHIFVIKAMLICFCYCRGFHVSDFRTRQAYMTQEVNCRSYILYFIEHSLDTYQLVKWKSYRRVWLCYCRGFHVRDLGLSGWIMIHEVVLAEILEVSFSLIREGVSACGDELLLWCSHWTCKASKSEQSSSKCGAGFGRRET